MRFKAKTLLSVGSNIAFHTPSSLSSVNGILQAKQMALVKYNNLIIILKLQTYGSLNLAPVKETL